MRTTAFTKTYSKRVVLSLPELEFEVGRITAIIGPNGSGKSTFAKILAGIERADDNKPILSGVGPFRHLHWLFTVKLMILAQVVLITPIIIGVMETFVADTAPALRETARGLGFGRLKEYRLLINECLYSIFSAYLLSFARAIAEVGAVAMVGGAIAWKTNVMTTAIMMYTNRGSFTLGIALGLILLSLSLLVNIILSVMQGRLSR